jgi:hypothetical protein
MKDAANAEEKQVFNDPFRSVWLAYLPRISGNFASSRSSFELQG